MRGKLQIGSSLRQVSEAFWGIVPAMPLPNNLPNTTPEPLGRVHRGRRPIGTPAVEVDGLQLFRARRAQMITIPRMVEHLRILGWQISGPTLRNYETGRSKPMPEFVPVLSKAYGVPLPRLVRVDPFAAIQAAPVEVPPNDEAKIREALDDIMAMIAELKAQQQ